MSELQVSVSQLVYPGAVEPVLSDLEFHAASGEFLAVLGPSGCGKTTMLNAIAGLNPYFEGTVQVDGSVQVAGTAPSGSACMFQEPRLMPWLTVAENIALVLDDDRGNPLIMPILDAVGLAACADNYPHTLSGGMQRRVALARAFVIRPSLLLLDEPFLSLDAPTAARLRELLVELWQGIRPTVLLITHDLREAVSLADRIVFLSPSPSRVVLDIEPGLKRPRDCDSPEVSATCEQLLREHPQLLSGIRGKS